MANGFLSRLGRQPVAAVNAPTPQAVVNAKNNANTTALSNALKNYVKSIRTLRNSNPFGISRNVLINNTAANRNKINRAIANYVMNVNKAKYLNTVARQAIPMAQTGEIPESTVAPVVNVAAQQNIKTARAAENVKQAVQQTPAAPPPPPPPRPVRPAPPPPIPSSFRQAAAAAGRARLERLKTNPLNIGKRTKNNKAVYAVNSVSNNYYGKKNNSNTNYYKLKLNENGQLVINNASPAYVYSNYKFQQKN